MFRRGGNVFKEKEPNIPIFRKVDVVVVGGGPAGLGAAVAAARNGSNVLMVERNSFMGGTATAGFVNQFRQMYHISGIAQEVVKRLGQSGGTDPEAWHGYYHRAAFDLEELKFVYMDLLEEAGVKLLMNTWAVDAITENQEVKGIIIENKSGRPGRSG
jgi:flavin-dependent dehydrogenase